MSILCYLFILKGLLSSEREYDTTILKTIELNKECGEASTAVVRVFEEYEPAHFLQLFKGKMVAFKGIEIALELYCNFKFPKLLEVTYNTAKLPQQQIS